MGVQRSTVEASQTRQKRWGRYLGILLAGLLISVTAAAGAYFVLSERGKPSGDATAGSNLRWRRIARDDANLGEGLMVSVAWDGSKFVAIGSSAWPRSSAWTSSDGIAWSRVPDDELNFGSQGQSIDAVTAGGPGFVAVGFVQDWIDPSVRDRTDRDAAAWASTDGATWSVSRVDDLAGEDDIQAMSDVTAGGPGLVAVGEAELGDYDYHAAVWTSTDGIAWARVPHDEQVFGGDGYQRMEAVTAGGPGLVAVGLTGDFGGSGNAAVWTSTDGLVWDRVPDDQEVFGGEGPQQMLGVAVGGPGLVAVGVDNSDAAVWTSVDGTRWVRLPHDEEVFGGEGHQRMAAVTTGGPGLVAVGVDHPLYRPCGQAAVWVSTDGVTWSRWPHDEEVFGGPGAESMSSSIARGDGVVIVGGSASYEDCASYGPGQTSATPLVWSAIRETTR